MRTFWLVYLLFLAGPIWAQTRTFEVMDRQGFDKELVVLSIEIPQDWKASGEVLWIKPCSGNDLYEITMTFTSPDGLTGARMLPGHQVLWSHYQMSGDPGMAQLWQSQQEAERNELRTQFQGSNCHLAPLQDAKQLFNNLVLAKRPANTRVVETKPLQAVLDSYKQIFTQPAPGSQVIFDANQHELKYAMGKTPITERVDFSWYMFQSESRDPSFYMFSQHTIVESIQISWYPDARAQTDHAILEKIGQSISFNAEWQNRVNEAREKLARQRRDENDKNARDRKRELKERDRRNDKRHSDFLRQIWQ